MVFALSSPKVRVLVFVVLGPCLGAHTSLLVIFRTPDPVALRHDHYIRRSISHLGAFVARHSLLTIIVTVAIGVSLCSPILFQYRSSFPAGYFKLPDCAWTLVDSLGNDDGLAPDISIKQAWVYGGWMKALERDTILEAVAVQEGLLGPILNYGTGPDALSFIHSPLLYWNCSAAAIQSDHSIIATINRRARQVSPANITLSPSSVFTEICWSSQRLVAADALVISLFYKAESRAGDLWDDRAAALAQHGKSRWDIFPAEARGPGSRFFRFQSRPIPLQDEAILFGAYGLVALYVIFNLRDLRMLKSRVGLFLTVAVQGCLSILIGLALSGYFRIDISNIPSVAYPFIILVIGLENMFRLINEVEKTPPQNQSEARVAAALGAVGHLSLISAAQNIVTLLLLSRVISPGLAAFCGFAAISLTVDLMFFFTFFVAMLSVDLRRYELEDSFEDARELENIKVPVYKAAKLQRVDVKRRRKRATLPYPRVWGTISMVSFLFLLNRHFFNGKTVFHKDQKYTSIPDQTQSKDHQIGSIHKQTGDLADWLKLQEHQTTREIFRAANPQAQSILARVYNPLVIVLKSADRNPSFGKDLSTSPIIAPMFGSSWLPVVLFCSATASIIAIWNHSLRDGQGKVGGRSPESPLSSVQCLPRGHSLDVFMLGGSSKRLLSSVGFDHEIRVWNLGSRVITSRIVHTPMQRNLWPVSALAIDGKAEWLAVYSKLGEVSFWHIQHQCFGRSVLIDLDSWVIACFFTSGASHDNLHSVTRLLLVGATGRLVDVEVETGNVTSHQICANRVRSAHTNSYRRMPLRVITVSEGNRVYVSARRENCWTTQALDFSAPILNEPSGLRYTIVPDLSMVALVLNVDTCQLHLIDLLSGVAIHTFRPRRFVHHTLRAIHSPPQQCLFCGAVALMSFSVAFTEEQDRSFTMITLSAEHDPRFKTGLVCLRAERDFRERRCIGFRGGVEKIYSMPHAGVWEATGANGVAGVRQKRQDPRSTSNEITRNGTLFRRKAESMRKDQKIDEAWEAWTMTATGMINTHTVAVGTLTNRAGPMCSIGRNAIAVGLAEDIVLVKFGNQLYDDDTDDAAAVRKTTRTRLTGRPKIGLADQSGI